MPPGQPGSFIDWSKAYLDMDIELAFTNSAGGTPYIKQGVGSLFRNVRVFIGDKQVETVNNYNIFQQMIAYSELPAAGLDSNWVEGNYSSAATAQSWHSTSGTSRYYSHKPKLGLFSLAQLFPAFACPRVRLELDMASTSQAIVNPGTNTGISYTINNLRLVYESYKPDIEYLDAFDRKLHETGVEFSFPTISNYQTNLMNAGNNDYYINDTCLSAKAVLWGTMLQSNFASSTADYQFIPAGLQSWWLKYGPDNISSFQLQFPEMCYEEYLDSIGQAGRYANLNSLTYPNYTNIGSSTAFTCYQGLNLENFASQLELSGINLRDSNGLIISTTYGSGSDSITLLAYVMKDMVVKVYPDKELLVSS